MEHSMEHSMKDPKEIKAIIYQYIIDNKGLCTSIHNVPELSAIRSTICSYCGVDKEPEDSMGFLRCAETKTQWRINHCKEYFVKEILEII